MASFVTQVMDIKEKVLQYLEAKGISPTRAEVMLKWGKGALIKPKSISSDKIGEFLLLFDDLSAEWLFRGTGEMLLSSRSSESDLIEELKAELNMLKGENNILREQFGLQQRGSKVKTA